MIISDVKFNVEEYFISKMIVNCIPAWIRFAQCIRRYRDTGESFPHLANAGKYSTTFFVVFARALLKKTKSNLYLYLLYLILYMVVIFLFCFR